MTIYGCRQNKKQQQDNLANLEASLAPAEAEFGALAKADQYRIEEYFSFFTRPIYCGLNHADLNSWLDRRLLAT